MCVGTMCRSSPISLWSSGGEVDHRPRSGTRFLLSILLATCLELFFSGSVRILLTGGLTYYVWYSREGICGDFGVNKDGKKAKLLNRILTECYTYPEE